MWSFLQKGRFQCLVDLAEIKRLDGIRAKSILTWILIFNAKFNVASGFNCDVWQGGGSHKGEFETLSELKDVVSLDCNGDVLRRFTGGKLHGCLGERIIAAFYSRPINGDDIFRYKMRNQVVPLYMKFNLPLTQPINSCNTTKRRFSWTT